MAETFLRFEFKYPVLRSLIGSIERDLLKMGFKKDEAIGSGEDFYYVSTIYFDTPTLQDYHDKAAGLLERKKVRARTYARDISGGGSDSGKIWLEIKEKHDMMISKKRVCVSRDELDMILLSPHLAYGTISPRLTPEERPIFSKFIFYLTSENRKPYVLVQYKRKAFQILAGSNRVRITLDYDILAEKRRSFCRHPSGKVSRDLAVMELKFSEKLPALVKFILDKYNLRRDVYSKYNNSIDVVRKFYPIHH